VIPTRAISGHSLRSTRHTEHHSARVVRLKHRVIRLSDLAVLGAAPSLESATRIAGVISTGQRKGYAEVRAR